jgi:hypothetical protein
MTGVLFFLLLLRDRTMTCAKIYHKEIMLECGDELSPGGSTCLHNIGGKIMSCTATHASTV